MEKTLVMLKPDAVIRGHIGNILSYFEKSGLKIAALKMRKLTRQEAEAFYAEHKEQPFFPYLIDDMTADPIITMVLEGHDSVKRTREIMGATDPKEAAPHTIRKDFAL
ncbi:MAG: nucleoside-diphosphate kinase, partial [bacterium]